MKKKLLNTLKTVMVPLPFIFGFIGLYLIDGQPLEITIYYCLKMYTFGYSGAATNVFIVLARWFGPVSVLSGIILLFSQVRKGIINFIKYHGRNSVAVYGPADEKQLILSKLGKRGIDGENRFVRAQRYILLDDETKNFEFYHCNRQALSDCSVYLKCHSVQARSIGDVNLHMFCAEEMAARMFWMEKCIYPLSCERQHKLKIVFLGFGNLGEALLTSGLSVNIFSPEQCIEYHIFGDGAEFSAIHTSLSMISDPVIFHNEQWYQELALIEQADMVLVLEQREQMDLLENLLLATNRDTIDVFSADSKRNRLLDGRDRLRLFDWKTESQDPILIFTDKLFERAKKINLRYSNIYSGVEENETNLAAEWKKLNAFTRYSNISAADYHSIRLKMLEADGLPKDGARLPSDIFELLSELEHIRWCRYHYLNNWRYGEPENGKAKDSMKRIHRDLVPYSELSDDEKEKDRENIRILLSLE